MNRKKIVLLVTVIEVLLILIVTTLFSNGIISKTAFIGLALAIPVIVLPLLILVKRKLKP